MLNYCRNIHPSKEVVTFWSLAMYVPYAVGFMAYFALSTIYDQPYSLLVESCSRKVPREISPLRILVLTVPNLFNVVSLATDILMIRFLHKTIMPGNKKSSTPEPKMAVSSVSNQMETHGESINFEMQMSELRVPQTEAQSRGTCMGLRSWISAFKIEGAEKVPIRVSILSSCLILPYIAVQSISKAMGLTQEQRTYVNWISLAVTNTIRCPTTVILAFKSNAKLAASRKKEIRDEIIGALPQKDDETVSDSDTF